MPDSLNMTSDRAWTFIRRQFLPMRTSIHSEMLEKWAAEVDTLRAKESRLRKGGYLLAVAELEIDHTEELTESLIAVCCNLWTEQGRAKSQGFFQAVWEYCLLPLFKDRRRVVICQLERRTASGFTGAEVDEAVGRFQERLAALRAKVRLRIEAGDCRFMERRKLAKPSVIIVNSAPKDAGKSDAKRKARKLSSTQMKKQYVVFAAIQQNFRGAKYCRELDDNGISILQPWQDEGCPKTYVEAYKSSAEWRKRIQDEKHRYNVKYDRTSPAARLKLN